MLENVDLWRLQSVIKNGSLFRAELFIGGLFNSIPDFGSLLSSFWILLNG